MLQSQAVLVSKINNVSVFAYPHTKASWGYVFVYQRILDSILVSNNHKQWLNVEKMCSLRGRTEPLYDGSKQTRRVCVLDLPATLYLVARSRSDYSKALYMDIFNFMANQQRNNKTLVTQYQHTEPKTYLEISPDVEAIDNDDDDDDKLMNEVFAGW